MKYLTHNRIEMPKMEGHSAGFKHPHVPGQIRVGMYYKLCHTHTHGHTHKLTHMQAQTYTNTNLKQVCKKKKLYL